MKKQTDGSVVALHEEAEHEETRVELRGGRSLTVEDQSLVELRSPDGEVELRIEIGEDGPVLRATGMRLALSAEELSLQASKALEIGSEGTLTVRSRDELKIEATDDDVRVRGEKIHLN